MSNTVLGTRVNIIREFKLFDALPEWVRELLRNAQHDYHVEPIARLYVHMRERGLSQTYMSYEIRQAMRRSDVTG